MNDYEKPLIQEKPLTEKDLISYAYQVARGMEFLSSKMVHTTNAIIRDQLTCAQLPLFL